MFRVAAANLPGPVTYFTKELANWRADPTAKNSFSYKLTDADRIKGGNAPVKKAPNAPTLQAAIDNAGGELQRGGASGAMSFIGAMPVKKYVPGSAQGVLPVKGDFIEALWTEDGKVKGWFAAARGRAPTKAGLGRERSRVGGKALQGPGCCAWGAGGTAGGLSLSVLSSFKQHGSYRGAGGAVQ
jgi:hypothetical protein